MAPGGGYSGARARSGPAPPRGYSKFGLPRPATWGWTPSGGCNTGRTSVRSRSGGPPTRARSLGLRASTWAVRGPARWVCCGCAAGVLRACCGCAAGVLREALGPIMCRRPHPLAHRLQLAEPLRGLRRPRDRKRAAARPRRPRSSGRSPGCVSLSRSRARPRRVAEGRSEALHALARGTREHA